MSQSHVATPADLATLLKFRKVLDLIQQELDPDMPIGYLRTMVELMIAHIDTGPNRVDLTQKDLIERTDKEKQLLMFSATINKSIIGLVNE